MPFDFVQMRKILFFRFTVFINQKLPDHTLIIS